MHGFETVVTGPIAEVEAGVREALAAEGFGVLTEIDVAATFKEKLGIERAPLRILGACNPALAQRAIEIDGSAALVLPCNVVLEEQQPGRTWVTIADPRELMPESAFADLATEAARKLTTVAARVGQSGAER